MHLRFKFWQNSSKSRKFSYYFPVRNLQKFFFSSPTLYILTENHPQKLFYLKQEKDLPENYTIQADIFSIKNLFFNLA